MDISFFPFLYHWPVVVFLWCAAVWRARAGRNSPIQNDLIIIILEIYIICTNSNERCLCSVHVCVHINLNVIRTYKYLYLPTCGVVRSFITRVCTTASECAPHHKTLLKAQQHTPAGSHIYKKADLLFSLEIVAAALSSSQINYRY